MVNLTRIRREINVFTTYMVLRPFKTNQITYENRKTR